MISFHDIHQFYHRVHPSPSQTIKIIVFTISNRTPDGITGELDYLRKKYTELEKTYKSLNTDLGKITRLGADKSVNEQKPFHFDRH